MSSFILFLSLCLFYFSKSNGHCDSNEWIAFEHNCFLKSNKSLTKQNASLFCKEKNATMVKIDSDGKFIFIKNLLNSTNALMYTWVKNFFLK